ncbi:hypothetical protein DO021_22280 [Desulfobacter hydrogenophilus]|uniref:Uncharacterized protein n=1 Tax=Desulfobacter hydrogenophilus TaxID=2291 RepID=A0A328F6J5_9BACT|nr:hypothetical protein DO021_22280 [Desulfobacter hydrogenophilus]
MVTNQQVRRLFKLIQSAVPMSNGVGPSKFLQPIVNSKEFILNSSKIALSSLILTPKWGF